MNNYVYRYLILLRFFFLLVRVEEDVTIATELLLLTVQDSVLERDSVPDLYLIIKDSKEFHKFFYSVNF
jgi:hypothetical protein